ncbi:MAG: DUF2764 family protein [Alistipes sp.]|nr:DUF2764 family protein [Alistipes sp.]MBR3893475.1 DUF2764 family protein [Alistipes sp.]
MFSKEYYYLVAGLKEWTLESDTKGFDVAEIRDEILEAISDSDRQAVRELYAYYDCENIIAAHAGRDRYNPLGNLSKEEVEAVFSERCYSKLPKAVAEVVKRYNEADDDERDDEVALDDRFERAVFEAYYLGLEKSKCSFLKAWGEFDRNLRNIAAAVAAREANRSISDVVVGRGEVVEQLTRSSAADFGLRGELQYIDSVIAAVSDERNIVEKERKIDAIRWAEAEDIVVFDFFNINFILSYLVKVNIVARWNMLSPEVGRRMLERLMQELDSKELVNKQ